MLNDTANDRKINFQGNRAVQTEGRMPEICTNKRQDGETQSQHNTDNTTEPVVITNPKVMGGNNNENNFLSESTNKYTNKFLSELITNENQSFVSEQLREDDMAANVKQTSERDINNM